MFTIKSDISSISVESKGAKLCSFKINGCEHIYNEETLILFPIIGFLKGDKYIVNGVEYHMPKHGFAKSSNFVLVKHSKNSLVFQLKYNNETLKIYPYKFVLTVIYTLELNVLKISTIVENIGEEVMLFTLGAHPGFNIAIDDNISIEDYSINFEKKETVSNITVNNDGFISGETEKFLENCDVIKLTNNIFDNDALILKGLKSNYLTIDCTKTNRQINVWFDEAPYVGLWSRPGGNFICVEPWFSIPDYSDFNGEFKDKEGIMHLSSKRAFTYNYSIMII